MRRAVALAALVVLAGCSSTQRRSETLARASEVALDAGSYAAAFDAARHVLRDAGFELRRVDARAGLITTAPLASAGVFTPWIGAETNAGQSIEGSVSALRRTAEVRFEPVGGARTDDVRAWDGPLTATITVALERPAAPASRLSPVSITLTSRAVDPLGPGAGASDGRPERVDLPLAERLAAALREKL